MTLKTINNHIGNLLLAAVIAMLFVSCSGTSIKLPEILPAEVDLGRGATVALFSELNYQSSSLPPRNVTPTKEVIRFTKEVTDRLATLMRNGGYYTWVNNSYLYPDYSIIVRNNNPEVSGRVSCEICLGRRGKTLWKNSELHASWSDNYLITGEVREVVLSRYIYNIITPHKSTYKIYSKPDKEKNSALYQAVAMAKAEQWEQAKLLALQAVQEHPDDAEGYFLLGALLRNDSRFNESDTLFRKALSLRPDESRFSSALEKNRQMRKNEGAAISQWEKAN